MLSNSMYLVDLVNGSLKSHEHVPVGLCGQDHDHTHFVAKELSNAGIRYSEAFTPEMLSHEIAGLGVSCAVIVTKDPLDSDIVVQAGHSAGGERQFLDRHSDVEAFLRVIPPGTDVFLNDGRVTAVIRGDVRRIMPMAAESVRQRSHLPAPHVAQDILDHIPNAADPEKRAAMKTLIRVRKEARNTDQILDLIATFNRLGMSVAVTREYDDAYILAKNSSSQVNLLFVRDGGREDDLAHDESLQGRIRSTGGVIIELADDDVLIIEAETSKVLRRHLEIVTQNDETGPRVHWATRASLPGADGPLAFAASPRISRKRRK